MRNRKPRATEDSRQILILLFSNLVTFLASMTVSSAICANPTSMDRTFVPIIYEKNPAEWLKRRVPSVSVHSIVHVGQKIFHVLVTNSDAAILREHLTRGLIPPFCRRQTNPPGLELEPGLVFTPEQEDWTVIGLRRTIDAYKSALPKMLSRKDQIYVGGKIRELEAKVTRLRK